MGNRFSRFHEANPEAAPSAPGNRFLGFHADQHIGGQSDTGPAIDIGGLPLDASPIAFARDSLRASAQEPSAPSHPSAGQILLTNFNNTLAGARQGTMPHVFGRKALGEVTAEGDIGMYFTSPDGKESLVDPQHHVVLTDPGTGKLTVFERTPDMDENRLSGVARVVSQGLLTGPAVENALPRSQQLAVARGVSGLGIPAPTAQSAKMAERIADVATRTSGAPGVGLTRSNLVTNAQIATRRADEAVRDAEAFQNLGVRPLGPAFSQGPVAGTAKQLSETPFIGAPLRNAIDQSLAGAGAATGNVAGRFGSAGTAEEGGVTIRQGLERFKDARPAEVVERETGRYTPRQISEIINAPVRETSFKTKQSALYQRAWDYLPEEMQRGRTVTSLPRLLGGLPNTQRVLDDVIDRNLGMLNASRARRGETIPRRQYEAPDGSVISEGAQASLRTQRGEIPIIAMPVQSGPLGQIIQDIASGHWRGTLQDIRNVRSELRRLASGMSDTERNTLKLSDIDRLQMSLTQDMVHLLERNAAEYQRAGMVQEAISVHRAIREFRRADRFTALSFERIEKLEKLFNAPDAETLFQRITDAAFGPRKSNMELLRSLSRVLRDHDRNRLASAILNQLGRPVGSARGASEEFNFSVGSAMTRWNNMMNNNPAARFLIFGNEHARALDDLSRVWRRLAHVEAQTNTSRSGTNVLNVGGLLATGGAITAGADAFMTALGSAGIGYGASLLLSRPSYVKWATKYAQLRGAFLRGRSQAGKLVIGERSRPTVELITHINKLRQLAANDNELEQLVHSISAENGISEPAEEQYRQ